MDQREAVIRADAVIHVDHVVAGLQILKIGKEGRNLLAAAMVLRQMLGLIEDVGFGVDLESGIRQPQAGRNLSDADDRNGRLVTRLQRLLAELGPERDSVFVQNVAQPLGHADRAAEKNHLAAGGMRDRPTASAISLIRPWNFWPGWAGT